MNITDILSLANGGDSKAMMDACFYYYDEKDFDEAAKWAEKAAEAGQERAPIMLRALRSILGIASCGIGAYDEALKEWSSVRKWATYCLQNLRLNEEEHAGAIHDIWNAEYYTAFCYYRKEMYRESIEINTLSGTKASILRALCIDKIAINTNNPLLLRTAFQVLTCLERDAAYFNSKKDENEELIFVLAVHSLAGFYTLGLVGFLKQDLNRAVYLLESALNTVVASQHKSFLQNRLAQYQKNMFGGYRYIN